MVWLVGWLFVVWIRFCWCGYLTMMVDVVWWLWFVCIVVCRLVTLIVLLFIHYTFAYSLLFGDFALWCLDYGWGLFLWVGFVYYSVWLLVVWVLFGGLLFVFCLLGLLVAFCVWLFCCC